MGRHNNNPVNYNPEHQSRKYPFGTQFAPCGSCARSVDLFANPFPFFCPFCRRMTNLFPPPNYGHTNYSFGSTTFGYSAAEIQMSPIIPQDMKIPTRRRRRTKSQIEKDKQEQQQQPKQPRKTKVGEKRTRRKKAPEDPNQPVKKRRRPRKKEKQAEDVSEPAKEPSPKNEEEKKHLEVAEGKREMPQPLSASASPKEREQFISSLEKKMQFKLGNKRSPIVQLNSMEQKENDSMKSPQECIVGS